MEKLEIKEEINRKNENSIRNLLDKINSKVARVTSRSLGFYKELLWLNINDIDWENILNVWAWNSNIENELKKLWIENSFFINTDIKSKNWVISDMRNLSFKDESFDKLLYLWSMSWILYKKDKIKAIKEALRVTKQEWYIFIYPVVINSSQDEILDNIDNIETREVNIRNIFRDIDKKDIKEAISQIELIMVDLYYKYSNKIKWNKTVSLKIKKDINSEETIKQLEEMIINKELII